MPTCLVHAPHAIDATSFAAADVFFFDTFLVTDPPIHKTLLSGPSPYALMDDICDDKEVTSITYADDVFVTYRDDVTNSRAHHTMPYG
jgi:hypothetical protein